MIKVQPKLAALAASAVIGNVPRYQELATILIRENGITLLKAGKRSKESEKYIHKGS